MKEDEPGITALHRRFFTRVYPSGARVDSSNYSPIVPWASGSQIVALNQQTKDEAMLINWARFRQNGGVFSGYVLKPSFMLSNTPPESLRLPSSFKYPVKKYTVTVLSGSQLKAEMTAEEKSLWGVRDVIDPYVVVGIRGLEHDNAQNETRHVDNNGLNPQWGQTFVFHVSAPDFAFMKFEVYDKDMVASKLISWYAIALACIRPGYRIIPLLSRKLIKIPYSYVLVKISVEDLGRVK
jgi:hypothetical protein